MEYGSHAITLLATAAASLCLTLMAATYLVSLADWAPVATKHGAASASVLRRRMRAAFRWGKWWLIGHAAFHASALAMAFAVAPLASLRGLAPFYLMNSMAMVWMAPAGIAWGREIQSPAPSRLVQVIRKRNIRSIAELMALLIAAVALSAIPVLSAKWTAHPELSNRVPDESSAGMLVFLAYAMVSAPVAEETFFRQYLLCRLAATFRAVRWTRIMPTALAVVVTTIFFAACHSEMIEPAWVKWVQITITGVALSICQLRHGLLAAMAFHFLYNSASVLLALVMQSG